MKIIKITTLFSIAAISLAACNGNTKKSEQNLSNIDTTTIQTPVSTNAFPVKEVIAAYLNIKNALAKDNSKDAARAGTDLKDILSGIDIASLPAAQGKIYQGLQDDLKEHSEHIADNGRKIDHQRSHFEMLSMDIADLVKAFRNGGQTFYTTFCPMANDSKGATWISELKEIKNPYMGKKMLTCGTIIDTIK